MPNDQTLSIIIKLQDDASAGLSAIADKVKSAGASVGEATSAVGAKMTDFGNNMQSIGRSMSSTGQSMSIGLTLPIVALGKMVVDTATKFQASMELIRTQAGASQAEVDNMTKSVLALAKSGETGQGPQKLADGLYHLESLGLRGAQAMDALKISAQGADLGLADMEGVTNALGAAIVTGIKGTQNYQEAMGLLDATIGQGNMRMDDLVAALGTGILPAAKNFGLTLQDVGAALATLTDNGMRADESATRLRMTFSLMAAPTQKAKDALATIGLGAYDLANDMRGPNGLVTAVEDLNKHLKDSGQTATEQAATLSEAFGGGRTSAAILTLTQQVDRLKTKYDQIGASAGSFAEKVAATHETNQFKMNAALAQMQSTMIDLGGTVLPIVADMLKQISGWMQKFTEWWDTLNPSTQAWIVKGLALVAVLGPILVIVGTLTSAIGSLVTVIGGIVTGVGAMITAVSGGGLALSAFALAAAPWLVALAAIAAAVVAVTGAFNDMQTASSNAMNASANLTTTSQKLTPLINSATGDRKKKLQDLQSSGMQSAQTAAAIATRYQGIGGIFNAIGDQFGFSHAPSFADGGVVPGSPGQAVPIIAHAGETVIPVGKRGGGDVHLHFNFNGTTAGDDGIKQIITRTVQELNRSTTLRNFAGA